MSAPAEITEGTITTDGTEQVLATISTSGIYTLAVDTTAMLTSDSIILRAYRAANSSGPAVLAGSITYTNAQASPLKSFGPFTLNGMVAVWNLVFSIERVGGTDRAYPYAVEVL